MKPMQVDATLPKQTVQKLIEDHGADPERWNEELQALVNPSIQAKPSHLPMSGLIKEHKHKEFTYFWAFDRCGANPNHERVEQLRSDGWTFASTDDVVMMSDDAVKGRNDKNFSDEIRSGDRRLMKISKQRWLEIRKAQLLQAMQLANPRGLAGEDRAVMGTNNLIRGVRTEVSDETVEAIRARAVITDASQELATGQLKGNASAVRVKGA